MRSVAWSRHRSIPALQSPLLVLLAFAGTFVLYARTAAPSVLSGDSGEFQFAAPLLGVPHPTGYPLFVMLGKLATLLPFGDVAYRVTLVSALAGACTVALLALLVLRVTGSRLAALIAASALAVAPGLWHLATIAEVYTLNTALLALLALLLENQKLALEPFAALKGELREGSKIQNPKWLYAAAFVTGLGISNHGSFAFIGAPLLLGFGILPLWLEGVRQQAAGRRAWIQRCLLPTAYCTLFGALGLTPWLFVLVQYARFGPFDGLDHGLPRAYFWGAPTSWGAALAHVVGGTMRGGVFDLPGPRTLLRTALVLWDRLQFEFGPLGVTLGVIGCYTLLRRPPWLWLGSAWVAGVTALYFASLGQAVQDAPVFTLPLLLPWALWIGVGAQAVASRLTALVTYDKQSASTAVLAIQNPQSKIQNLLPLLLLTVLFVLMLAWGRTRLPYGNKADQWLFRDFGAGALAQMQPDAVVLTRWEQGTILQYLLLVEGQRPDVWVDIVELEDEPWRARAARRYPDRPLYIIGSPADGAALGAEYVWGTDYAAVYRLTLPGAAP